MSVVMNPVVHENYNFQKVIVAVGFSLMVIKFVAYYLTSSVAIFTDALESIVNVVAGCIGLCALYLSAQPPDRTHPYGHGRVETISASVEGTLITVAGALIIFESVDKLLHPSEISSIDIGLILVIFAAVVNYITGRIAIKKGIKNHSPALEASGKHLCTDTYSSIGIIAGLSVVYAASMMGHNLWWLDSSLALLFGALIIVTGFKVMKSSLDSMMDKADEIVLSDFVVCLNKYRSDTWIDIHNLRVIKYGSTMHVEFHVTLPGEMTIEEEESEKENLMNAIHTEFGSYVDLILSPEPCEGINCSHCKNECSHRKKEFIHLMEWNVDLLIQGEQHCDDNGVHYIDNIKE